MCRCTECRYKEDCLQIIYFILFIYFIHLFICLSIFYGDWGNEFGKGWWWSVRVFDFVYVSCQMLKYVHTIYLDKGLPRLGKRLPRLGRRELILVLFVRLFDLRLFSFACFLFLLVSVKGSGL